MTLSDLSPTTLAMKAAVAVLILAVLEAPAAYLWVSRGDVQAELTKANESLAKATHDLGVTQAQLATSQTDLGACSAAAKVSSDSIAAAQARADAAEAQAVQLQLQNAKQAATLASTIKTRTSQISAPAAPKETCDAAIQDLRAGK